MRKSATMRDGRASIFRLHETKGKTHRGTDGSKGGSQIVYKEEQQGRKI